MRRCTCWTLNAIDVLFQWTDRLFTCRNEIHLELLSNSLISKPFHNINMQPTKLRSVFHHVLAAALKQLSGWLRFQGNMESRFWIRILTDQRDAFLHSLRQIWDTCFNRAMDEDMKYIKENVDLSHRNLLSMICSSPTDPRKSPSRFSRSIITSNDAFPAKEVHFPI